MGISSKQFAEVQARLGGGKATKRAEDAVTRLPPLENALVLGIDPSLRGTGYGILQVEHSRFQAVTHGTIRCPAAWAQTRCLAHIASTLREVIRKHPPLLCVVEGLFHAQNVQTALIMGQARGAGLAVVAEAGLEIYELAPRRVKQAIVGYGGAQKDAVAKMVQRQLALAEQPDPDAADALALAMAFAQMRTGLSLDNLKPI